MCEFADTPEIDPPKVQRSKTYFEKFCCFVNCTLNKPVQFVHDTFVVPDRPYYEWYHHRFRRVPTIDECEEDDIVCFAEANIQYKRDRLVDSEILSILRQRFENCVMYETPHHLEKCRHILNEFQEAENNWFTKYGDLGGLHSVLTCYMKQKHRMLWERRHGEVGTGMKDESEWGADHEETNPCVVEEEEK